jgi:LPS export ABC transporter protein LptC
MNINISFFIIFLGLMVIYIFFKPMQLQNYQRKEIANFEVENFIIHELNSDKLITLMQGSYAYNYPDRYEVKDVNYTDSSKKLLSNIVSKRGIYKDQVMYISGDVVFKREDGLTFKSQKTVYNEKTGIVRNNDKFVLLRENNSVTGDGLIYNNILNKIHSKNVRVIYNLKEK